MNAKELLDFDNNSTALVNYYYDYLTGNGGQTYSRLYLDLDDNTIYERCFASCNEWNQRDDGSLVELHGHNNYGCDLSDDELEQLEENGVGNDFGFMEFCDEIEEAIEVALDHWQKRNKKED